MADTTSNIAEFLREQARKLRELANSKSHPNAERFLELAEEFEQKASDIEKLN